MLNRRQFLIGSAASAAVSASMTGCRQAWTKAAYRKPVSSQVAILPAATYSASLTEVVRQGIELCGLEVKGRQIVLKPNLVEFDAQGVINTHPAVIAATIEALRSLGAGEVIVAEGAGHHRDTEYLLTASGLYDVLKALRTPFVDLNTDDVQAYKLQTSYTDLRHLYLPQTILKADLLVSMPKMKTHHWVGGTLAMKNLFGLVPGAVYGWPKNVLHWAGINQSILDINSSIPIPHFAIVDGVVAMEGNGPIQGAARPCGIMAFGRDLVAVDATVSRLMQIDPERVPYLAEAAKFLGNINERHIQQVGEAIKRFEQDFLVLPAFRGMKATAV